MFGCKVLCIGGIIIVDCVDCVEIEVIMEFDFFFIGGVVEYEIIEFVFFMMVEVFEVFCYFVDCN